MTVDWFLVDAPGVVPEEFEAWLAKLEGHGDHAKPGK